MQSYIEKVNKGQDLTFTEMAVAAERLFQEETPLEQIEALLVGLAAKGETATELAALAQVMKQNALTLQETPQRYIDNCGTGGDGIGSFNISTTTAFVLAAGGVPVAKHGNRKISSLAGSADTLEELGIHADFTTAELKTLLDREGLAFIFAPKVHPKLKRIGQVRQKIGKPTIFNLVGPLANPVELTAQFTGINRKTFIRDYAEVMQLLGRERGVVVYGAGGLDEASLAGENRLAILENGDIREMIVTPESVGLKRYPLTAIQGGDGKENADIVRQVLQNKESAYLDTVLLNAGIGFFTAGKVQTIEEGIHVARKVIASGAAYEKLQAIIAYSKAHIKELA
ncbi:anthranilate phosphoribosyltransferase [Kurthia massiliensis]|uniref:anthranilate phosphoribosyltransferase n=1 Tax=Kurthia massiliensis TaxID=1033739 RepID=UPI000287CC31|nr:anthranilate phosphoribosyltransferase [Kurthia massiliensis]